MQISTNASTTSIVKACEDMSKEQHASTCLTKAKDASLPSLRRTWQDSKHTLLTEEKKNPNREFSHQPYKATSVVTSHGQLDHFTCICRSNMCGCGYICHMMQARTKPRSVMMNNLNQKHHHATTVTWVCLEYNTQTQSLSDPGWQSLRAKLFYIVPHWGGPITIITFYAHSHAHSHKRPQQQIAKRHTKHMYHFISHSNLNYKSSKHG